MKVEEKFPEYIDNTMVKDFMRCPQFFFRKHVQGLQTPETELSIGLHFGGCFAAAIEAARKQFYVEGQDAYKAHDIAQATASHKWHEKAYAIPIMRTSKTFPNLQDAITRYLEVWPLGEDGLTPIDDGIEYQFQIPLGINHPATGKELAYVGRMDMLARDGEGNLVVVDEKTASQFSNAWVAQWDMDTQMSGYLYAANRLEGFILESIPRANIRGVGISSKGIDTTMVPVYRSEWHLADWWRGVRLIVMRMLNFFDMSLGGRMWPKHAGNACVSYARPCEYTRMCSSPNSDAFYDSYVVKRWNPLNRTTD